MGTKTDSFAPMYQVNFHSDLDTLRPGQVVIRIPASLFELTDEDGRKQGDRNGKLVLPDQVAVPKGTYVEGETGTFEKSNVSPFNYDIVDNGHGSKDIVFWNYKEIPSGTTAAWQVAYPVGYLQVVNRSSSSPSGPIIDESRIKLTPSISIPDWTSAEVTQDTDGSNSETVVHTGSISATATPLTGLVDTYVRIDSVWVSCSRITSESSLKAYIGEVPAEYSGENFDKYYYVRGYEVNTYVTGNQPCTTPFAITEELYRSDGELYGDGWEYKAPMRKSLPYTVHPRSYIDHYKHALVYQNVVTTNDVAGGRVKLSYAITGYEGYYDRLRDEPLPDRTEVKIYDLLPTGVHLDRDVAPIAKDKSYGVEATGIVSNYSNTGRELVEFTIACPDGLPQKVYRPSRYFPSERDTHYQSAGITFAAYISWDDMESSKIGPNIAAWIPSDGGPIIGKDTQVSLDDNTVVPGRRLSGDGYEAGPSEPYIYSRSDFIGPDGMSLRGSDINGDGITDTRSVLYSSSTATANYAVAYEAGIDKKVRADAGGVATNAIQIKPGEDYTYDFTIKSRDATSVKDVTVFDRIENVETNHWQGIFRGVSYDDAAAHGATGVTVWYNADRDAPMPDNKITSTLTAENILTATNGWTKSTEWTAPLAVRSPAAGSSTSRRASPRI